MSTQKPKGTLVLIPLPITEGAHHTLPQEVYTHTLLIQHYFAENVRTARRFLRSLHATLPLDNLQFSEIDKHSGPDIPLLKKWLSEGKQVGIMSEAGCPAIADPGSLLVATAHLMEATVVPLTGPSSIILALMASGLSGQNFAFCGYLPVKEPARSKRIKELETHSAKEKQTQIFIETPYRNNNMLADLLKNCANHTQICVAANISAPDQYILTRSAALWKKEVPVLGKYPVVFLMQAF